MNKHIVGTSDKASIAVFIRTGPIVPVDVILLATIMRDCFPAASIWRAPDGVGIQLTSNIESEFRSLNQLRSVLSNIEISDYKRIPWLSQELLVENLMALDYTRQLEQCHLTTPQLYISGAVGMNFSATGSGRFDTLFCQIRDEIGAYETERLQPERVVDCNSNSARYWIESQVQSGSFLRICRPLPDAKDYSELLGRSVVNALIGGLGNSLIAKVFRDRNQLCYNPYSVLTYMGGYQWLTVDLDTTTGNEEAIISRLKKLFNKDISQAIVDSSVRHAVRFMMRTKKGFDTDPELAVRLDMTKVDGSDPFGASFAQRADFDLDRFELTRIANRVFDFDEMSILTVSQLSQPEWFLSRKY